MKYYLLILTMSLAMVLTACKKGKVILEKKGETTLIKGFKYKPDACEEKEAIYILAAKMLEYKSYIIEMNGDVIAKKGIIIQKQVIDNFIIKDNEQIFFESISNSVIKSEHQVFIKNNKVVYRNSTSGDYINTSKEEYNQKFGVTPGDKNLLGYIFNDETIIETKRTNNSDGTYTFIYKLSPSKATPLISIQTKEFGGLNDFPIYKSIEMTWVIDAKFNPISLYTENNYSISVPVLGNFNCVQKLNYNFRKINQEVEIPNSSIWNEQVK